MNFNSYQYAFFLPIVFALYWLIPKKTRWLLILASSLYFYMNWNVKYVLLMLMTVLVSYVSALGIARTQSRAVKKLWLTAALVVSMGVLFFYKYFNFASNSLAELLGLFSIQMQPYTLKLLLPVGISFYTFQAMSYTIDVYLGKEQPITHIGKYTAFVTFFPQLVAGPIERTANLYPQIAEPRDFDYDRARYGLRVMLWGFFKKMVIADSIAQYVDAIYNDLPNHAGFSIVLATVLFAIQIYCDFSGYSDIALGSAKLLGIDLMRNFKSPYFSASIKEFWSRWHISLSTWFRDYIYIPLGGNRVGKIKHWRNLMITFLVSGLWHGANWTYFIWGGVHGLAQIVENILHVKPIKDRRSPAWLPRVLLVFIFSCFAWLFFRAQSMSDAVYALNHLFTGIGNPVEYIRAGFAAIGIGRKGLLITGALVAMLLTFDFMSLKRDVFAAMDKLPTALRWVIYLAFVWLIILLTPREVATEFIYFQF